MAGRRALMRAPGRDGGTSRGTWWLPVGLLAVGASGYGYLGVVGYLHGPEAAAPLAVLWTVANVAGGSLFVPVEQELTRRLAAGAPGRLLARAVRSTGVLLAVLAAVAAVAGRWLDDALFSGVAGMTWCAVATCAGFALQHLCRGVFAAAGRYDRYGGQLVLDGAVRAGGAVLLAVTGPHPVLAYGVVLAAAPLVSLVAALGVRAPVGGSPADGRATPGWNRDLGLVLAGQVGSTLIVGAGPVAASALAGPGEQAAVAVLVGVLVVARVPLLGLYALQAVQLPGLTRLATHGLVAAFRRRVSLTVGATLAGAAAAVVPAWLWGPSLVALALGPGFRSGAADVVLVCVATLLYIGAALTCQALLALDSHGRAALAWLAGVAVYAAVLATDLPVVHRVEVGFLAAAVVTLALATVLLRIRCHARMRPHRDLGVPVATARP